MTKSRVVLRGSLLVIAAGSCLLSVFGTLCYVGFQDTCLRHPGALGSKSSLNQNIALPMIVVGILLAFPSMYSFHASSKFKTDTIEKRQANALKFLYSSHF